MPNQAHQLIYIALAGLLGISHGHAHANSLCPSIAATKKSEGAMPIPEKNFTEQTAKLELQKLNKLLGPDGLSVDPVTWETSFVFIEGWYLKRQALEAKKHGEAKTSTSDFCDFIKNRAYVRH